jgi:hypothetical protein
MSTITHGPWVERPRQKGKGPQEKGWNAVLFRLVLSMIWSHWEP